MKREATPAAIARIWGNDAAKDMRGCVTFRPWGCGTIVEAEIEGLPGTESDFFAFHIHEKGNCRGQGFPDTGGHYNPGGNLHPMHGGDLPPLLRRRDGRASLAVVTDRFRVEDIIGRSVVIHEHPDDFHTQPSGGAGNKIGCGLIRRWSK